MTPEDVLNSEWDEIPIPTLREPEELFVWLPEKDDTYKRTLRCMKDLATGKVFVIVYDRFEEPTQSWRVRL